MDDMLISLLLEGVTSAVQQKLAPIISFGAAAVTIPAAADLTEPTAECQPVHLETEVIE